MGTTLDFIAATLADSLLPMVQRSMEDTVYETLDRRQIPSRTDFKELRDLVNGLRGQVTGTASGVERLAENSGEILARLAAIENRLDALENEAKPKPKPRAAKKATSPATKQCKVDDCGTAPKTKGFCSRHYQQWRRGTLKGFPKPK